MYPNAGTLHPWKFIYIERDAGKWDKEVDNIMKENDPAVEEQLRQLTATQDAYEKSRAAQKNETASTKSE